MADTILQGEKITRVFQQGKAETKVLDGIDIKIFEKDFTVIMEPSGAGKSTLLYSLSGMDQISGGRVLYRDQEISGLSEKRMARLRAEEFGFVFQQTHLVSNLTLLENVLVAGYVSKKDSAEKVKERAANLLRQMDVEEAKDRLSSQVSGGEAQRAAMGFTDPVVSALMRLAGISNFASGNTPGSVLLPGGMVILLFFGFAWLLSGRIGKEDMNVLTAES